MNSNKNIKTGANNFLVLVIFMTLISNDTLAQFPFPLDNDSDFTNLVGRYHLPQYISDSSDEGGNYSMLKRFEDQWVPRLFPSFNFNVAAHAIYDYSSVSNFESRNSTFCTYLSNWIPLGPDKIPSPGYGIYGLGTGQIHGITFDPQFGVGTNQTMYVSSAFGGLFKSTDAGTTWSNLNTDFQLPLSGVSQIVIDPNDGQHLFISVGGVPSIGVYRSMDGGVTWQGINTGLWQSASAMQTIQRILINPLDGNTIFIATGNGIYMTRNALDANVADVFWYPAVFPDPLHPFITDIQYKPGDTTVVFASGNDIWETTGSINSQTWVSMTGTGTGLDFSLTPFNGTTIVNSLIDVTNANANYLYSILLVLDNSTLTLSKYLYKFDGTSWSQVIAINLENKTYLNLEVSNSNADAVFEGENTVFRFIVGTSTSWNQLFTYGGGNAHPDIHCVKFSPDNSTLYVGCDGGLFRTTNPYGTSGWSELNNGLQVGTISKIGVSNTEDGLVLIGEQDDGNNLYDNRPSNTNSNKWKFLPGAGDGADAAIVGDDMISSTAYGEASCVVGPTDPYHSYMRHSNDNWQTYNALGYPDNDWDKSFVAPIAYDPVSQKLVAAWRDLYRNIDFNQCAQTPFSIYNNQTSGWLQLSALDDFYTVINQNGGCVLKIGSFAIAPSDNNYIYAIVQAYPGFSNSGCYASPVPSRIFRTTYGGINTSLCPSLASSHCWEELFPGVSSASIVRVTVHPNDPTKVWICYSGYDASSKVLISTDAGTTWTNYSAGLPNLPTNCIIAENGSNDGVYVGTDAGVYYRNSFMSSWECYNSGLPNVQVRDMEINYGYNKIYAGTWGRALWESHLACPQNVNMVLNNPIATDEFDESYGTLTSSSDISNNAKVVFRATDEITLGSGFWVHSGCDFRAFIHGCDAPGNSFRRTSQNMSDNNFDVGENKKDLPEAFSIYPNPSSGIFKCEFQNNGFQKEVFVYDAVGRTIWEKINSSESSFTIDISNHPKGLYFVKVVMNGQSTVTKLVYL